MAIDTSGTVLTVLTELALNGRLTVEAYEDGGHGVGVTDDEPIGDPVLDDALATIADAEDDSVEYLLRLLTPGLHPRLLDRLAEQGVLTPRARRRLSVTATFVWRAKDTARREELRTRLAAVLLGQQAPDRRGGALTAMLFALDAVEEVHPGTDAIARAGQLARTGRRTRSPGRSWTPPCARWHAPPACWTRASAASPVDPSSQELISRRVPRAHR